MTYISPILRPSLLSIAVCLSAGFGVPVVATAQGFALHGHPQTPSTSDGLALQLPSTLGHLRGSVAVTLDYAASPLVASGVPGADPNTDLLGHRLQAHAALALGLGERFELHVVVPMVLDQGGDDPGAQGLSVAAPESSGLADAVVGGSARLLGDNDSGLQLGVVASLVLPTGSPAALAGDDGLGGRGGVMLAAGSDDLRFAVESGVALLPSRTYGLTESGSEMYARAGVHVGVTRGLRVLVELQASSRLKQFLRRYESPAEALLGLRYQTGGGLMLGVGGGVGLTQAPGVPSVRGLLTLGYAFGATVEGNQLRVGDANNEPTTEEAIPRAPAAPTDSDHDGVDDLEDRCPSSAEDVDGFEDDDGCPDEDNDRDGVPDESDACPNEAEEMTGDGDGDGCPGTSTKASSPTTPSEPRSPEPAPSAPAQPGWKVVQEALPAPITFSFQSEQLTPEAERVLIQFAALIRRYPRVRLSIEGHASLEAEAVDRDGLARQRRGNMDISRGRAERVARILIARGARAQSIETRPLGSDRPLTTNDTESGRAQNRRVEIRVLR